MKSLEGYSRQKFRSGKYLMEPNEQYVTKYKPGKLLINSNIKISVVFVRAFENQNVRENIKKNTKKPP